MKWTPQKLMEFFIRHDKYDAAYMCTHLYAKNGDALEWEGSIPEDFDGKAIVTIDGDLDLTGMCEELNK